MTETCYLAEDVFFCVAQGYGVFLDLKRDAYSAIPIPRDLAKTPEVSVSTIDLADALLAEREVLLEEGLLSRTIGRKALAQLAPFGSAPTKHIFGLDDQRAFGLASANGQLGISIIDVARFFLASRKASRNLKTRHIAEIVRHVRDRKIDSGGLPADHEKMRRQTAVFRRLRPWYPREYLCLFDALALLEFLARQGLFPQWVFAVQAQPFGAHCWLESEGCLLNEGTEYAGQFTPIMVV